MDRLVIEIDGTKVPEFLRNLVVGKEYHLKGLRTEPKLGFSSPPNQVPYRRPGTYLGNIGTNYIFDNFAIRFGEGQVYLLGRDNQSTIDTLVDSK